MSSAEVDIPKEGITYSLVLGDTFASNDQQYHTLQYNFKPASIDSKASGILRKSENGGLEVEMVSKVKNGTNERVVFKGNYTPSKEIECILVFDKSNNSFRLERLSGSGKNLKTVRNEKEKRGLQLDTDGVDYETDDQSYAVQVASTQELEERPFARKRKAIKVTEPDVPTSKDLSVRDEGYDFDEPAELQGDEPEEYEQDTADDMSMLDLLNQIESNTQNISDAGLEPEEDTPVYAPPQIHNEPLPNQMSIDEGSGESSESESDSESGESQSSSASDGDGSSSESD